MKRLSRTIITVLILVLIGNMFPVKALATIIHYSVSVTPESQYMSNWCWAACARMAGKTMYYASSRSQFAVVNLLKGDAIDPYPNVGGYPEDSVAGSEYVAYYHRSFSYTSSPWPFHLIQSHIASGKPVQALQHHNDPASGHWNHMVIITQTAHVEDSSGTYYAISYIDPLDGNSYSKSYGAFCNETVNNDTITYTQTMYVSD